MKRLLTLAMAVYGQPKMLKVWFDTLRSYDEETLAAMELIIVDDHGDPAATIPDDVQELLPCSLFRVKDNIKWNQPGARNLAVDQAETDLVLLVDPDMVFTKEMMPRMVAAGRDLQRGHVIRYCLRHRSGTQKNIIDPTSPNTWFMHVADFLHTKGYSEDFSGHKGWSDVQLLDVIRTFFKTKIREDLHADFYKIHEVSDAAVESLDRSVSFNRSVRLKGVFQAKRIGWIKLAKLNLNTLRFRWERVI